MYIIECRNEATILAIPMSGRIRFLLNDLIACFRFKARSLKEIARTVATSLEIILNIIRFSMVIS